MYLEIGLDYVILKVKDPQLFAIEFQYFLTVAENIYFTDASNTLLLNLRKDSQVNFLV
jgi:hypothetical protein